MGQGWKVYRTCTTPPENSACENIREDVAGFVVDLFAGIGGVFYLVGTILFHFATTIEDSRYTPAVVLFTCGGISFFISAVAMQKRYFFD